MPILKLDEICFGGKVAPILDKLELKIEAKERICLIGRNGVGKSTLLKIIQNKLQPDSGHIWKMPELKIACLSQEQPKNDQQTVFNVVAQGLEHVGKLLQQYHDLLQQQELNTAKNNTDTWITKLGDLQHEIDQHQGWVFEQRIKTILSKLNLPENKLMSELSGGWCKRVILAQTLVLNPDLLLLDEPTNHLDIETIEWLENYLLSFNGAILCISHDRSLVNKLATRIIEIDRGRLISFSGNYSDFQTKKEQLLQDETKQNLLFDKKLAQEEIWIRQGIKARRTRNEGRVRALQEMRNQRQERRQMIHKPSFKINTKDLSGQLTIEAKNINYAINNKTNNKTIIKNFTYNIMRGDRIGIVGPNGCGKTTLIKILLKQLQPTQGTVRHGTVLNFAYFDQLTQNLDPTLSVMENVAQGQTHIELNGKKQHIIGYLQEFLFTPERSRSSINNLSGGERNRLLLAKLFSNPCNFLILDEPTNDLDIESLELLEDLLINFTGTILLVSHDRSFMDQVVTNILAFNKDGIVSDYVGSYSDWLENIKNIKNRQLTTFETQQMSKINNSKTNKSKTTPKQNNKINYKLQRELNTLPDLIESLESKISTLQAEISQPDFYNTDKNTVSATLSKLAQTEKKLEAAYLRWNQLDN